MTLRPAYLIQLVTNVYSARDLIRGRTVPPIRSGPGPWDGRAPVRFADLPPADQELMQDAYDATRELLGKERMQ